MSDMFVWTICPSATFPRQGFEASILGVAGEGGEKNRRGASEAAH